MEVEESISLAVWIEGAELADEDWAHVRTETRSGSATLNEGVVPSDADAFEVDGITVSFSVTE